MAIGQSIFRRCYFTRNQILFCIAVALTEIGCNYCMDIPGSLEVYMNKYFNISTSQFSLFYSFYSLPTIATNLLGGYLIDRWLGVKWTTVLFALIAIVGLGIFSAGGILNTYWMILLGRLLFGLGNEMATGLNVSYCMFLWYVDIMNFVNAINSSVAFIGTMAIYQTSPRIFNDLLTANSLSDQENLGLTMLITSLVILPTVLLAYWMVSFEPKSEEIRIKTEKETTSDTIRISDVYKFSSTFWILCAFGVLFRSCSTFTQFIQGMFTEELHLTVADAGNAVTISNIANVVVSLPLSLLVDKIGHNIIFVGIGVTLQLISHILFHFGAAPYLAMLILGVSAGFCSSSFTPMYGFTVNEKKCIGTCYGLQSSTCGLTMFASPFIMGYIIDKYGFKAGQLYYVVVSAVCIGVLIFLWAVDKLKTNGILNMNPKERLALSIRNETEQADEPEQTDDQESFTSVTSIIHRDVLS